MQVVNNYDLDVFNGDIGVVTALHEGTDGTTKPSATVEFPTGASRRILGCMKKKKDKKKKKRERERERENDGCL